MNPFIRIRYYLEFIAIEAVTAILRLLPLNAVAWISNGLGSIVYCLFYTRRAIALKNLDRAYGSTLSLAKKKRIVRKSFEHMVTSMVELFLARRLLKNPTSFFTIYGQEHLDQAHANGKGTMFVISHLGSWECLSFHIPITGYASSTVVKAIKSVHLDRKIASLRSLTGLRAIHKEAAAKQVLRDLRKNQIVAILIDQWAGPEGIWVNFFGEPTSTTSVPARLAIRTGCSLIFAYCIRIAPWKFEIHFEPIQIAKQTAEEGEIALTQQFNHILEKHILDYPEQWTWVHRRWKPKPQGTQVRRHSLDLPTA